ncbi:nucleoside hydrolase [Micromonospora sp. U21]|uniref:nucleoside hydrolase n=1 Tax=Micromonospora sp. U21 TaxID=2824899 RepID=UPI001B39B1E1|nr:nucleoside hydrolase [Micromonospora sp. U21]MBQ0904222.1 nucleoside hydrolase [Micromonospora sp. U21]
MDNRHLVLLDTDIGNDIDDAVCLAYLLAQPRCDLLGITTVTAEPEQRAALASVLCQVAGRRVPIYPGAAVPMASPPVQGAPPQAAALARWDHDSSFPAGEAVEFLRRTIHAHPGQVTLLAIGPLTNVALLFAVDPQIPSLLRSLVMMGGAFADGSGPEWNIHCDPYAAARVYAAAVPVHRSIGLDVTNRVRMKADAFLQRCDGPLLRPVADMAASWFADRPEVTFHDPLAAATLFDSSLCSFAAGEVAVRCEAGPAAGTTTWRPADDVQSGAEAGYGAGPGRVAVSHEVALDVREQAFLDHYFAVVEAFPSTNAPT